MPNAIKGEVPLNLADGREFILVLDFEALVEAESVYGKPLAQVMKDASAGFVGASRALLYGALKAKQPAVTPREASALFLEHTDEVAAALEAATVAAFPDKASAEGNAPMPKANPPGKRSGRSGAKRA